MKRLSQAAIGLALTGALGCSHAKPAPVAKAAPQPAAKVVPARLPFEQRASVDVPGLNTHYTPEALTKACADAEKTSDAKLAALVSVPANMRTFANTFGAFEQATADYIDAVGRLSFLKDIHPDAKVRAAAAGCEEQSGKYMVKVGARKDIFQALNGYAQGLAKVDPAIDGVDKRLIELTLRDFKRNGLELSDADREKLVKIRQRLAELATQYSSNLDEDTTQFTATRQELEGMPESFISRLKLAEASAAKSVPVHGETAGKKAGKAPVHANSKTLYVLTTKYPDYYPVMENAKSEALRKRMELAFEGRQAAKNIPLLTEAISLRDQAAKLLGYATHADYVTEVRMAKNAKTVADFLARLKGDLLPARDSLNAQMLALKVKQSHNKKAKLQLWDWRYELNQLKKKQFDIDNEKVRAYFPADKVMEGMFQVYSTLFDVAFTEVPGADVWADGVKLYEVHDGRDGKGKLLAKFYVDLFPRPGKYGHAASFTFGIARDVPGGYQIPLSALVVNFNPPENGKVARLAFEEVDTLFHEFGHIMHQSLTEGRYASLSGTNVSVDFVEAPSQMLENWVYQPQVLALVSADPADPTKPMPAALAKRLAAARTFDAGIRYTRQVFLATYDQALHTRGAKVDPDAVNHELEVAIMGYPENPEVHLGANFGHLMGGYDAGYYGYLWSEVFADDMFGRFEKDGVLNPKTGREYRDDILARGREVEPEVLLQKFLGRAPNEENFLRITGIKKQ